MSVGQDELQDTALYSARLEETAKARGGVGRGVVGQLRCRRGGAWRHSHRRGAG